MEKKNVVNLTGGLVPPNSNPSHGEHRSHVAAAHVCAYASSILISQTGCSWMLRESLRPQSPDARCSCRQADVQRNMLTRQ